MANDIDSTQVLPAPTKDRMVLTLFRGCKFFRFSGSRNVHTWIDGTCHSCDKPLAVAHHKLGVEDDLHLLAAGMVKHEGGFPPAIGYLLTAGGRPYCADCLGTILGKGDTATAPATTAPLPEVPDGQA